VCGGSEGRATVGTTLYSNGIFVSVSTWGYFVWVFYFCDCSSADLSSFPIYVVSLLLVVLYFFVGVLWQLVVLYFILLGWATVATCCDKVMN